MRGRGRERERGVDYFRGLLRETDEKEFSFRGIQNEIIIIHPRRDESDTGLKVVYGRREVLGIKDMKKLCIIGILEVRDRRSTDERTKRSGIEIEKNWAENGALGS